MPTRCVVRCLQVMLFVASAAKSPVTRSDLKTCSMLEFGVHAKEYEGETKSVVTADLAPLVRKRMKI